MAIEVLKNKKISGRRKKWKKGSVLPSVENQKIGGA